MAALSPLCNGEAGGDLVVPANIGELLDIHEDDQPEKNKAEVFHHFPKQGRKLAEVKGLGLVHRTCEDIRVVP